MDGPPPPATTAIRAWIAIALSAVAAGALGFWLGGRAPRGVDPWPSYAGVFEIARDGVVNVSLEGPEARVGSGFAVAPDEVVTARHLVVDAERIVVRDADGRTSIAEVVGTDARTDLALLEVPNAGLKPLVLGTSHDRPIGATVVAIGNPYGLSHSLAVGVVSGRGRRIERAEADLPGVDFLQLSVPLNPGNSGGPVLDERGAVLGILSGTHAHGQAIAFAIPVEVLQATLPTLRSGARVSRAFLGVSTELGGESVFVASVIPSSPADKAGILTGDRLTAFDDVPIHAPIELDAALDRLAGGARVSVRLLRDGQLHVIDVTLADWAEQPIVVGGMTLKPSAGAGGEVVAVRPRSRAEAAGILVGDVVRSVDGVPVRAPADIKDALSDGAPVQLDLLRGGLPASVQLGEAR